MSTNKYMLLGMSMLLIVCTFAYAEKDNNIPDPEKLKEQYGVTVTIEDKKDVELTKKGILQTAKGAKVNLEDPKLRDSEITITVKDGKILLEGPGKEGGKAQVQFEPGEIVRQKGTLVAKEGDTEPFLDLKKLFKSSVKKIILEEGKGEIGGEPGIGCRERKCVIQKPFKGNGNGAVAIEAGEGPDKRRVQLTPQTVSSVEVVARFARDSNGIIIQKFSTDEKLKRDFTLAQTSEGHDQVRMRVGTITSENKKVPTVVADFVTVHPEGLPERLDTYFKGLKEDYKPLVDKLREVIAKPGALDSGGLRLMMQGTGEQGVIAIFGTTRTSEGFKANEKPIVEQKISNEVFNSLYGFAKNQPFKQNPTEFSPRQGRPAPAPRATFETNEG